MVDESLARRRLGQLRERASHSSFIREFLCELSDSLHADAGDGKNALNQIRRRVNDIIKESGAAGAGRSALDARFALGADDATYANAAIAPIYASFDTDELDMVDTPAEVREASAVGVVSAFDAMLETKRATAVRDLRVCARFVGRPSPRRWAIFRPAKATEDFLVSSTETCHVADGDFARGY